MQRLASALLLLAVWAAASQPCRGQEAEGAKREAGKPAVVRGSIVGRAPGGGYRKQIGEAYVDYVPAFGKTTASVTLKDVFERRDRYWTMSWKTSVAGKKIVKPETVTLEIYYVRGDPTFAKVPVVSAEIDEGIIEFGKLKSVDNNLMQLGDRPAGAVTGEISFQQFGRIAGSKRIRMRVGGIEFELSDQQSEALRDLLKTVER